MRCILVLAVVCSCSCSAEPTRAPKTIDVPLMPERAESATPPTRDVPVEQYRAEDALPYFTDTWDGLVNGTFPTELRIDSSSRFFINLKPNPKLASCHLEGKLTITEAKLWFEIEQSTCAAEHPGMMLIRTFVNKSEREFTVLNEDGSLTIRYTRRKR